MAIALSLPSVGLSRDEIDQIDALLERLARANRANKVAEAYYEGTQRVRNLGIAIPPSLRDVHAIVGWPGAAVDVLDERLDWLGWDVSGDSDPYGLDEVYAANALDVDSGLGHLDGLLFGVGFVIVGTGYDGEPDQLITVESSKRVTGVWDARLRRLTSALSVDEVDASGVPIGVTLYLPDVNIVAGRASSFSKWSLTDRDDHGAGRVFVAALPNRQRASRQVGRSEITRTIRSYTDQGVRTLLGMEVNREFYSAPQRYALGADETAFTKADGSVMTGWEAVMGRYLAIPRDEDGELPQIGQFDPASPAPYLDQVKGLAQLVAGEAAIPASYMGFESANPTSADAIRAMESRLVKRAERRQASFGRGWREVGALALLARDGEIPGDYFSTVGNRWRDASTPTRAAAADEAVKLVGAGILPPDSRVTLDRLGFSPSEQRALESDRRKAQAATRISALGAAAEAARQTPGVTEQENARVVG